MATYKLLQDIEAEDHILGPLTLRQFIFALIAVFLIYINYLLIIKHIWVILPLFVLMAMFFAFFALPFGRDQPTEIWALAKLRFFFMSRKRIWNQDGVKDLVTITAPKKVERVYTNGLSQLEVKSRLKTLADTLDSRGWAIKHVTGDAYALPAVAQDSDRLLDLTSIPQEVPDDDIGAADDILDPANNLLAQKFDNKITQSSQAHHQQLIQQLNDNDTGQSGSGNAPNDYWFMDTAQAPAAIAPTTAAALDNNEEAALSSQLKAGSRPAPYGHMRTMQPLGKSPTAAPAVDQTQPTAMTASEDPAIISLAKNDDLNVSTLAREAKRVKGEEDSPDEVVIPLH